MIMNLITWRVRRGDEIKHEGVWSQVNSIAPRTDSPGRTVIQLTDGRTFTTETYGDVEVADQYVVNVSRAAEGVWTVVGADGAPVRPSGADPYEIRDEGVARRFAELMTMRHYTCR
jgi:hypothetical protein